MSPVRTRSSPSTLSPARRSGTIRVPPALGLVGDARLGTNRGVAILRDKVFFVTDNAHLLALDRASGKLLWETRDGADERVNPTAAPWRRSSSTIRSSPVSPAPTTAFEVSSPPSSPIPALWSGGIGRCLAAANPASKPGKARNPSRAAVPPGSPAPTTRHPTPSTGPPAIRGPTATTATVPATTSTPTAFSRSTPRPAISSGTINSRRTM